MKITRSDLFVRMEQIKMQIRRLEEEYKDLETVALDEYFEMVGTERGIFYPQTRENYDIADKEALIHELGQRTYIEYSTISKSSVLKAMGEKGFSKIMDKGIMKVKSVSKFFMFREHKRIE